jgi:hypothetical protein
MYLYKYSVISDKYNNTENLLRNSKIRLNSPDEFNDPFDLNILPRADLHEEDMRKWIEEQAEKSINAINRDLIYKLLTSGDFRKPECAKGIIEGSLTGGIRTHGIYCFSKQWRSIPMWSHYADKHKGICIRFNIDKESEMSKYLTEVDYVFEYPQVYINEEKEYGKFFKSKFISWQHESEVRIIKPKACGEYLRLNENEIDAVIFGIKSEGKEIEKVLNWISARKAKIKLFKALMVNRDYCIDRCPIDNNESISINKISELR